MRSPSLVICSLIAVICVGFVWTVVVQAAPAAQEIYVPMLARPAASNDSLNVTTRPDTTRAVSATIPLAGGQVVATSANNTRFTLTIPPNALVQTTTITLIPVAQIAGLPDVELVGAVKIEPLNALLLQAATLEIVPAQAVPVPQEYPFAYYRDGEDFHQYPIQPYSEGLVYPIGKFDGGYGIARTSTEAKAAGVHAPGFEPADPEARLRSQISELIQLERERLLGGQTPDPTLWPKVRDLALQYYNQVIKPLLQPSMSDCAFAKANIGNAVGWLRSTTLLFGDMTEPGADPAFAAAGQEIMNALIVAMKNCYYEATTPCVHWDTPKQVAEVLGHYRALMLMGAEQGVTRPPDVPQCTYVDVTLQAGAFHYQYQRNIWNSWDRAVYFNFKDDSVSSVGFYYPFLPKGVPLPGPTATISITARIDGVWQPVPLTQRFFCRDQKAERLQELMISFGDTAGEPVLPPQLYADNIGCWRWTGTVKEGDDYYPSGGLAEYYHRTSAQITLERDPNPYNGYFVGESQGELDVHQVGYRLVAPSVVDYDEKLVHESDGERTCLETLTAHITNPESYLSSNYDGIQLPNAGFGLPRKVSEGSSVELKVDLPYVTEGYTCPFEGDTLDRIGVPVRGNLSADGRRIQLDETGSLGEGSGTTYRVIDLYAQRE